jgi:DNA-binding XRE family transcriptional regulator
MTNLERIRKELSPTHRKKVEARTSQLIGEELTLQELRRARKLTQVRMAKELGVSQDGISKLEKRSDLLLSTLRDASALMSTPGAAMISGPLRCECLEPGPLVRRSPFEIVFPAHTSQARATFAAGGAAPCPMLRVNISAWRNQATRGRAQLN